MKATLVLVIIQLSFLRMPAQILTGTMLGTVTDTTGAVLPDVTVVIRNIDTAFTRTSITDQRGQYLAPQMPIGLYEVQARLDNFQTQIKRNVRLIIASDLMVNFSLEVSTGHDVLEVQSESPPVQLTSAEIAAVIEERALRSLPLNARDIQQLAVLQPGVQANKYHNAGPEMVVSGSRPEHNRFLLNGVDLTFTNPTSPVGAVTRMYWPTVAP